MQFREHPGVMGRRDAYPFDPRLLKIEPHYNVRDLDAADERDDLDELKESIRSNGVRVPLEVRLVEEDVLIIAGHRRHKAVMELIEEGEDIKSVPVMPEPKHTSEVDRIINLVVSNSGKPLKALEVAEVVRRLVAFGWDKPQIAKRLGWKSSASVTHHLEMVAMPEPVKEQVRENVISATEAAKLLKNLPKGTDPIEAAKMIAANKEENRRLGVGAKRDHKVTAKTLKRDKPKAEPKSDPKPEPEKQAVPPAQSFSPLSDETPPTAPVTTSDDVLSERESEQAVIDAAPAADLPSALAATPEPDPDAQTLHEDRPAAPQTPRRLNSKVDELLLEFISIERVDLALMHARLNKEHDEALADDQHTVAQYRLVQAADVIGSLRFEDEWESAKASSELAMVA